MKPDSTKYDYLSQQIKERILILDGAMGSLIQQGCGCHGEESQLADTLVIENPGLIRDIHRRYLEAGADIIETNSFNSNRFSLSDYGLEEKVYEFNLAAAKIAKEAAEEFTKLTPDKPRFVAGSVGPTKHLLSLEDTDSEISFDSMAESYGRQIKGLLDGGADIILIETVFDTLNAKAALYAVSTLEQERNIKIPVIVSGTVANDSGRLLSGQSIEAFFASVRRSNLLAVGLNCGFGSEQVLPYIRRLSDVADTAVILYPNAGLPDNCGDYHEDAETFSENLEECLKEGLVNIIGGCCGTTPRHIQMLAERASRFEPRIIPERKKSLILSNLDISNIGDSRELIQIGERTNVAGSAKFARLIREKNFDEALEIAARQVKAGASVIDICMDDALEDSVANMVRFLKMVNSDDRTGIVPVMIDSSQWEVISGALKVSQGKSIVNSISLKEGEEDFLGKAAEIRKLGAAAVVMLFDEKGQAETFERKYEIAGRAYRLLVEHGFDPSDIIFDPNVLTVGAGTAEYDKVAIDFIKATEWIKKNLPYASVSGGISNLSFAFRGNNPLREAMHTVFLYHALNAGLDMAIVNAGMLSLYSEIDSELLALIENLLLCKKPKAVDDLISYAASMKPSQNVGESSGTEEELPVEKRIERALIRGREKEIEADVEECLNSYEPLQIINEILMPAMKEVGRMFGEGKMFLPQVIKSAQVMKKAVDVIRPNLKEDVVESLGGKAVIATVRGDVHDIGKNIVGLVAGCNGYDIIDLGVRVEENVIADSVEKENPDALLLSGLISPSLNEMVKVCAELERRGLRVPVVIGGAATSEVHTAVKIAPVYSGPVFYSKDASDNVKILNSLSEESIQLNKRRQQELREKYEASRKEPKKADAAETSDIKKYKKPAEKVVAPVNTDKIVFHDFPIEEVEQYIDWEWLLHSLELSHKSSKAEEQDSVKRDVLKEAKEVFRQIKEEKSLRLEGVVEIFESNAVGDEINITGKKGERYVLPMQRATRGKDAGRSVADFIAEDRDYLALFAVNAGNGLKELTSKLESEGKIYEAFLGKLIADRLAEAFAQWVNHHLAVNTWKFPKENGEGIRIAFGYPSAPDHNLKRLVFRIMDVEKETSMSLTETAMIVPSEAVCGMILSSGEYINVGKTEL